MSNLKNFFFNFLHKKWIIRYIRCIVVNIRVSVCLLGCNFKFTGTLTFISAVIGTGELATAFLLLINNYCWLEHDLPWAGRESYCVKFLSTWFSSVLVIRSFRWCGSSTVCAMLGIATCLQSFYVHFAQK